MENRRYAPGTFIPSTPYWPGVNDRDPEFKAATSPVSDDWRQDLGYLHGIDLFNHGCYWDAHEAWEHIWLHLTDQKTLRTHLQGLIQGSACLLKLRLSQPSPAKTIWKRGRCRLESVSSETTDNIYRGIEIPILISSIDALVAAQNSQFSAPKIDLIGWP